MDVAIKPHSTEQIANGTLFGKGIDTYNGQNIKLESPTLQCATQFMTLLIIQIILTFVLIEHYNESLMDLHSLKSEQIDTSYRMQTEFLRLMLFFIRRSRFLELFFT